MLIVLSCEFSDGVWVKLISWYLRSLHLLSNSRFYINNAEIVFVNLKCFFWWHSMSYTSFFVDPDTLSSTLMTWSPIRLRWTLQYSAPPAGLNLGVLRFPSLQSDVNNPLARPKPKFVRPKWNPWVRYSNLTFAPSRRDTDHQCPSFHASRI